MKPFHVLEPSANMASLDRTCTSDLDCAKAGIVESTSTLDQVQCSEKLVSNAFTESSNLLHCLSRGVRSTRQFNVPKLNNRSVEVMYWSSTEWWC